MIFIKNLTHTFPGHEEPTLKDINLTLTPGSFCVLLGSNGSGKSTFLRLLAGEYAVNHGTIEINGVDVTRKKRSDIVACVNQEMHRGTVAQMTLLENMVLSLQRTRGGSFNFAAMQEEQIAALVKSFGTGLEKYLYTPLGSLSGGQRQMIATLMALHSKPELLLLDEHTSALDPKMQPQLMAYTAAAVTAQKATTLMITHNLSDALTYGDRVLVLQEGCITRDISGAEKQALTLVDLQNTLFV